MRQDNRVSLKPKTWTKGIVTLDYAIECAEMVAHLADEQSKLCFETAKKYLDNAATKEELEATLRPGRWPFATEALYMIGAAIVYDKNSLPYIAGAINAARQAKA